MTVIKISIAFIKCTQLNIGTVRGRGGGYRANFLLLTLTSLGDRNIDWNRFLDNVVLKFILMMEHILYILNNKGKKR